MKRPIKTFAVLGLAASLLGLSTVAGIAADKWAPGEAAVAAARKHFFHLGFAMVPYDVGSSTTKAGNPVPGAGLHLNTSYTLSTESGYFLTPNFAIAFSGGYPPTSTSWGAGSTAGLGALGTTTAGIVALNAQYHVTGFGAFQPYVGAGPAYLIVFKNHDRAFTHFHVDNALGFNFQIGADWMLSDRLGFFVDIKRVLLKTKSRGYLGADQVVTNVKLDPTIFSVGLSLRY